MSEQLNAVIYTQPHCGPCRMVEQFLEDNAVPFVTRDVTKDPVALNDLVERGFMATPVTHIGVQWIAGSTGTNQVRRSRSAKEKLHVSEIQSYEELTRPIRERAAQRSDPERQAHLQDLFAGLEREQAQQAPAIGDRAPDFTLQEAGTGRTVQLSDAVTRGPVVLSFYRGQWCPFCNLEVRALQSIHDEIRALGGDIYLIGPETEENALKLREKTESTIPLLFDGAAEICRAYGLAFELPAYFQESYRAAGNDLPVANPGVGWTLPIPATFVVGPDGTIAARHVDPDYRERMEPADILAAARAVSA